MKAQRRIDPDCIEFLISEIQEAEGNEIFALGFINSDGMVDRVEIAARGHLSAVPALPSRWAQADVLMHNHPSGALTPSDNDLLVASLAAESGIGSYIIDNAVSRVYVIAEPIRTREKKKLNPDKIVGVLEEGGAVASRLTSYEPRQAQLDLMRLVIQGFNEDAVTCAEAGTGVGKSFAYLVPAMAYAALNDERIVISTATITLQQQLYEKDIPLVAGVMKKSVGAVLIKGRANYLCLRRLQDALKEGDLFGDDREELKAIASWAENSGSGSKSDLPFVPRDAVWSRVCSEPDLCLGLRCSERESCFVQRLRKEAAAARILVVNHHLLFADLAARKAGAGYENTVVLPAYTRVVIDEAHTIEDAATSFFSEEFSRLGVFRYLSRLYRKRRGSVKGLVLRIIDQEQSKAVQPIADAIQQTREAMDALDASAQVCTASEGVFRLTEAKADLIQSNLFSPLRELRRRVVQLVDLILPLLETLQDGDKDDSAAWELRAVLRRLDMVSAICGSFLEYRERYELVFWLERVRSGSGDSWVRFSISPVDVSLPLKEALFEPNKTIICVSATLTVADSFNYWATRSGVRLLSEDRSVFTGLYPSPFPYDTAVLLASPVDAPLPNEVSYVDFVNQSIVSLLKSSGGSALVLFTSYEALKAAYTNAIPVLEGLGIRALKQGDDDRSRLLHTFLEDESSVLFATDSFWEGIDAPGNTLRLVILCRLPFRTPNEPIYEARREALERRGLNAFMELSLPESVMKLRQGFGRLMRRSDDHGAVVVLDGRLLKKQYGIIYRRSLPNTRTCFAEFSKIQREVESFLFP